MILTSALFMAPAPNTRTTRTPPTGIPTVADVERIAALDDLPVRNLQITQTYHELSTALGRLLGPVSNWCSFAVWASRQAGQSIRQEDLLRAVERALAASPEVSAALDRVAGAVEVLSRRPRPVQLQGALVEALAATSVFALAGEAASRGNYKVFAEIGLNVARYLAELGGDSVDDPERIARFGAAFVPGEPPGGQGLLRQAFAHYHRARFEPDAKRRSELVYLGSLEIGLHEQTRLQPEIEAALDAPLAAPHELKRRLLALLFPGSGPAVRAVHALRRLGGRPSPLDAALERLWAEARNKVRGVITEALMTYTLPGGEALRLGRDLPAGFPPTLQRIDDPDLRALLARLDATPDSVRGSAALDWTVLAQRMSFVVDFFRRYHEEPSLTATPPFLPAQVAALKAGRMPDGRL